MSTTGREFHDCYMTRSSLIWPMLRFVVWNNLRPSDGSRHPGNNLHVANLNRKMDNNEHEAIFGKVGRVVHESESTCPIGLKSIHHT